MAKENGPWQFFDFFSQKYTIFFAFFSVFFVKKSPFFIELKKNCHCPLWQAHGSCYWLDCSKLCISPPYSGQYIATLLIIDWLIVTLNNLIFRNQIYVWAQGRGPGFRAHPWLEVVAREGVQKNILTQVFLPIYKYTNMIEFEWGVGENTV